MMLSDTAVFEVFDPDCLKLKLCREPRELCVCSSKGRSHLGICQECKIASSKTEFGFMAGVSVPPHGDTFIHLRVSVLRRLSKTPTELEEFSTDWRCHGMTVNKLQSFDDSWVAWLHFISQVAAIRVHIDLVIQPFRVQLVPSWHSEAAPTL
jgi:hypothetical protein